MESKDPVSITDDPKHPATSHDDLTGSGRTDASANERLDDEERPTTKRPA